MEEGLFLSLKEEGKLEGEGAIFGEKEAGHFSFKKRKNGAFCWLAKERAAESNQKRKRDFGNSKKGRKLMGWLWLNENKERKDRKGRAYVKRRKVRIYVFLSPLWDFSFLSGREKTIQIDS